MIITGTSDKIQFRLGSATATNTLPFTVNYNNYTSSSVTPISNNGNSSGVTAVDLVISPSSNQQNELRYCSIYNADTVSTTVIIQINDGTNIRIVFRAVLGVGDMLQYQIEKGWEVIDSVGNKKNYALQHFGSSLRYTKGWRPNSITTAYALANSFNIIIPLGRADKPYTSINISYRITTAGAGLTWAEAAIYTGPVNAPEVANCFNNRAGFTSILSNLGLGVQNVSISVSGINTGDVLRLVFATVGATTQPQFRAIISAAVDISENTFGGYQATASSARPSTINYLFYGQVAQAYVHVAWQGV